MTPQSSVNFPKTHLKTAKNSEKYYKKRVMRAVFALLHRLIRQVSDVTNLSQKVPNTSGKLDAN
jgi:hypothetical protein